MLICILTKNVITSCSVTMMLFLHLEVKPLMTLTTVLYLSCALISGHLAMMLMELTSKGRLSRSEERFSRNAETDLVCRLLLEKKKADGRLVVFRAAGHRAAFPFHASQGRVRTHREQHRSRRLARDAVAGLHSTIGE